MVKKCDMCRQRMFIDEERYFDTMKVCERGFFKLRIRRKEKNDKEKWDRKRNNKK